MIKFKNILFVILFITCSTNLAQTTKVLTVEIKKEPLLFGLKNYTPKISPTVAVALSGGGSRGLAQIGVLKALVEMGIPIDIIVGTSMGSVVGGLYASGYSVEQLNSIVKQTDWEGLLASDRETNRRELFVDQKITEDKAIFALRLKGLEPIFPTAINSGQKLANYLNLLILQAPIHSEKNFDNLKTKFRAVATNLITGEPVILKSGSLSQAMIASSSVSFFLPPTTIDSTILVDGGLVANIPVNIAAKSGTDIVVAVNTTSSLHNKNELKYPWVIADQIVSIPMKLLNTEQLENADFVIKPNLHSKAPTDFTNIDSLILEGYNSALSIDRKIKYKIDSILETRLNKDSFYINNVLFDSSTSNIEAPFLRKYSGKDSVSSKEILRDIYSLSKTGIYSSAKAIITQEEKSSTIKFVLQENPLIKKITINGVYKVNKEDIEEILSHLIGKPYNGKEIEANVIRVLKLYRDLGYSLADVDKLTFDDTTGTLYLKLNEGIISNFSIEGSKITNKTIITREFPIKVGDYFKYEDIKQGLINLRSTNLFDDIVLTTKKNNHKNIVVLKVKEKTSSLLRVGFRADNENKAQLSLDLRDENLFGTATELGLLLFGGSRNRTYVVEHKANRVFDTYFTYKINLFYKFNNIYKYQDDLPTSQKYFFRSQVGEYRQTNYGGSIAIGTQVARFGNLIFQGKYQIEKINNISEKPEIPSKTKIFSLKVSSTIDTQDKYPYPLKGFYFNGYYETAQTILGGEIGYSNIGFEYKSYFTFGGVHTFSPRVMLGFGDKTLPLSEYYSLGGQNTFFGMRENEYRGRQLFLTSLEYRYLLPFKIFFDTYIKIRYDMGSMWEVQEQIRFKDLKHGIGTTLSFNTPIGPANFSVGRSFLIKSNLPGSPISLGDVMFYFSIGYYF